MSDMGHLRVAEPREWMMNWSDGTIPRRGDYSRRESARLRLCAESRKRCGPLFSQAFFQVANAVGDVGDAGRLVADLALDAQRAAVADLFQRLHELLDVRLPPAQRQLLAPLARHRRPVRVLHVHAADVRPQDLHRPDWVALVV